MTILRRNRKLLTILCVSCCLIAASPPSSPPAAGSVPTSPSANNSSLSDEAPKKLRDYSKLSHTLKLQKFRAGNHHPEGLESQYYFKLKLIALLDREDEKKLEFAARKQRQVDVAQFGDLALTSLSSLAISDKDKGGVSLDVEGDRLRVLVSETMTAFSVPEEQVMVQAEITLWRKAKKYYVLPADEALGSFNYFPIPSGGHERSAQEVLSFEDKVGTHIEMLLSFPKLAPRS